MGNGDWSLPNQSPFIAPHRSLQVPYHFPQLYKNKKTKKPKKNHKN